MQVSPIHALHIVHVCICAVHSHLIWSPATFSLPAACVHVHVCCMLLKQYSPPDCMCVGPHCPGAIVMTLYSAEHVQLNLAVVMPVWCIVALH